MLSALIGIALGFLEGGAYMASVHYSTKGRVGGSVVFYGVYYATTILGLNFLVQRDWWGVVGCGVGGAIGIAIVTLKKRWDSKTTASRASEGHTVSKVC